MSECPTCGHDPGEGVVLQLDGRVVAESTRAQFLLLQERLKEKRKDKPDEAA